MENEEAASSPPPIVPATPTTTSSSIPKKDENSPTFKLSIKREKTESGDVILKSEIIDTAASREDKDEDVIDGEAKEEESVKMQNSTLSDQVARMDGDEKEELPEQRVDDDGTSTAVVGDSAVSGVSSEQLWMIGDVVWCLQRGNPWWPCLVTNEFNSDEHSRYANSGSRTIKQYHVQFFGPKPLHAWIHENSVRPFTHRDEVAGWKERDVAVFKKMSKPRREKAMKVRIAGALLVLSNYRELKCVGFWVVRLYKYRGVQQIRLLHAH